MRLERRLPRGAVRLRTRLAALAVVTGVGVSAVLLPTTAGADPLADKQAQAREVTARLDRLDDQLMALSAEAERAKGELAQAERDVADARGKVASAQAELEQRQAQLRAFAVDAYMNGNSQPGLDTLLTSDVSRMPQIQGYLSATTANRRDLIDELGTTRQRAEQEGEHLSAAQGALADRNDALRRSLDDAERAVGEQEAIKSRLDGEIGQLVDAARQEEANRQAAAARQAEDQARQQQAARTAAPTTPAPAPPARPSTPAPTPAPAPPARPSTPAPSRPPAPRPEPGPSGPSAPVGSGATAAINAAMSKIGARYVWAAEGPDTFDCSGFTLWAWKHGGKRLPHYTGDQLNMSQRISAAEAQPGDLIFFWGPGTSGDPGHVGLYLGDGQFVHAPGSGKFVRVDSVNYWSGARVAYGRI